MTAMFHTVLVANRGEIACRVIRTLRSMGIRSVAVYSDADAGARHVQEADTAVRIGPAAAAESYLNIEAVLEACRKSGARAVHPGYGFLSENLAFAQALAAAGITFIGPNLEALNVMGDKIRSKNHVQENQVPVVAGIAEPGLSDAALIEAAGSIGYPILIKPSAGGGGKGMHSVFDTAELPETLKTARRVAASAFGDDTLFLERLVATPRHIEVQILGDNFGHVIHLGERECSLQRRHQKVIEEAPSALLDAATRARIGEAACNAARSVSYTGAGTVEFLVSDDAPDEFFFMEMNTRLQVEHPVTEMITGLDLVEWQIRIAAGEHLTLNQDDIVLTGHAIEARLYAENPEQDFLPETGTVLSLAESAQARNDSALLEGLEISSNYDPMLAKVIAWAPDRDAALSKLDAALAETLVLGVKTNTEYLRLLINDADVRAGRLDTTMIERKMPDFVFAAPGELELQAAAQFFAAQLITDSVWGSANSWRMGAHRPLSFSIVNGRENHQVTVSDGALEVHDGELALTADGLRTHWDYAFDPATETLWLGSAGVSFALRKRSRQELVEAKNASMARAEGSVDPEARSPMPGTVVSVLVADGDEVTEGQTLLAVEAMKMEHQLVAAVAGIVKLSVSTGNLVKANQILASIHPLEQNPAGSAQNQEQS
ncbi:acetyl/propionyl CoA carboxylase, alpha subunit [Renibacterium salmoninarum ATCC 33209]|uniref:biotin carboxylase n=1 Tax=Renibacterium salmoninarum (strain ATCC 33209 / DSM 20767 / JCM 11484 / NBRC 15589 / NCIMB 2235) TaxID=288705 RepID=A9WL31_RENSM|nr:biotin carboxylase N-terminal domain-containing protein [Renibacterium salmoninarum]ABY22300.1 acetyl/propionyl CoA carboxylase, alpha subunit [Renibacterium salmoninarum ATCC 33209]